MSIKVQSNKIDMFATRILTLRKRRGFTQLALAKKLFVSQEAISRYEAGISMPSAINITQLATVLQVSSDYLLGLSAEEQPRLSPQEREVLCNFRRLSAKSKERALGYLQGAAENQ